MFDTLPDDILRIILGHLDALSIVRFEAACKEIRRLSTTGLDVIATPRRVRLGMDAWLANHGRRCSFVTALRTCNLPFRDMEGVRSLRVRGCTVPPSVLVQLPRTLRSLTLVVGRGMTEKQRDNALSNLPALEYLHIGFEKNDSTIRFRAPDSVVFLTVNCPTILSIVSFPPRVRYVTLRARDGIRSLTRVPRTCASFRLKCDTGHAALSTLFPLGIASYPFMHSLDVNVRGMPVLMDSLTGMPRLRSLRCVADTICVGDELVTSPFLKNVALYARYCFCVAGLVREESVRKLRAIPFLHVMADDETFDLAEFFDVLVT